MGEYLDGKQRSHLQSITTFLSTVKSEQVQFWSKRRAPVFWWIRAPSSAPQLGSKTDLTLEQTYRMYHVTPSGLGKKFHRLTTV